MGLMGTYRWRNIGYILTEVISDACECMYVAGLATIATIELNQIYEDAQT